MTAIPVCSGHASFPITRSVTSAAGFPGHTGCTPPVSHRPSHATPATAHTATAMTRTTTSSP
jgi:hypothetical protein